ncbi:hypothetical protein PCI56_24145 [Plesiomonas shigelloides subsp. oncorhynchi]|nr:hypothetical protein [Plesiomonas shigelloides]
MLPAAFFFARNGIVLGALLLTQFSPLNALGYLQQKATALVWDDGALNWWNIHILLFLFLLGGMTAMLTLSGGSRAFAQWARQRIKTQRGAKLLTVFLGAFIFIDDYFNSLAVGSIARPVTDRAHISRAKLAYILDSTAAPVCVMMPASSWGVHYHHYWWHFDHARCDRIHPVGRVCRYGADEPVRHFCAGDGVGGVLVVTEYRSNASS